VTDAALFIGRWFNLRDNLSSTSAFGETSGLLTSAYARKPAFSGR
jgi:hypothetical protein